jgi:hypothetical protein
MPALSKRQVEVLLAAIDTDALAVELARAVRWVVHKDEPTNVDGDLIGVIARRLRWSEIRLAELTAGNPQAMAELAVELAERRSLPVNTMP